MIQSGFREDFVTLIAQLLPREEWPRRQNQKQLNWRMLVKDFGVASQPAYKYFTAIYGTKEAERIYDEHMRRSKEWWTAKEQREKLPALRNVLLEFFDTNALVDAKWDDILYKTKQHPMFDRYFKPMGQSLSMFLFAESQGLSNLIFYRPIYTAFTRCSNSG